MALVKFALVVLLILFVVSALFGLAGFLVDIVRYPQKHDKVKIIPSSDTSNTCQLEEIEDGLILDTKIKPVSDSIFGGDKEDESSN